MRHPVWLWYNKFYLNSEEYKEHTYSEKLQAMYRLFDDMDDVDTGKMEFDDMLIRAWETGVIPHNMHNYLGVKNGKC